MSEIKKLLDEKGDAEFLLKHDIAIEGGGEYKGHQYMITFTKYGTRCGYVELSDEEKLYFKNEFLKNEYGYPDLNCHGGITLFEQNHITEENGFWIGFDAAHAYDGRCAESIKKYFTETENTKQLMQFAEEWALMFPSHEIKSYEFMVSECKSIIDQIVILDIPALNA